MRRIVLLTALLVACSGSDPEETGPDGSNPPPPPGVDPDVQTWVPAGYGATAPARIVYLGDSITAAYGVTNTSNAYPELLVENNDQKWEAWSEADLESLFGAAPEIVDLSISGATAPSLIAEQLPLFDTELGTTVTGETLVAMTIGGNDMMDVAFDMVTAPDPDALAEAATADFVANMRTIMDFIIDPVRFPDGVYVYATNVYEPTDGTGYSQSCFFGMDMSATLPHFEDANADTLALAQEQGWAWVDMRGHFLGHGKNAKDDSLDAYHADDPSGWFQGDCIHPNNRGHHELRRLFHAAIEGTELLEIVSAE